MSTSTCATLAVYDVAAAAIDWEDMARSGPVLHFGDNAAARASVTVYDVPEPGPVDPPGPVHPTATRVLTYPDGAHDAESLLIDPTSGRLVIVTKTATGRSGAYRAPLDGDGVMEKVGEVAFPGLPTLGQVTGGDASDERIVLRTYLDAAPAGDRGSGRAPLPALALAGVAVSAAWFVGRRRGGRLGDPSSPKRGG